MLNRALCVNRLLLRMVNGPSHRRAVSIAARVAPRWAQALRRLGASIGEAGLENEGLSRVRGKGLANRVYLLLHVGHGPSVHAPLQDPHVPREILARIGVEFRIG